MPRSWSFTTAPGLSMAPVTSPGWPAATTTIDGIQLPPPPPNLTQFVVLTSEGTPVVAPYAGTIESTSFQAGGAGYTIT